MCTSVEVDEVRSGMVADLSTVIVVRDGYLQVHGHCADGHDRIFMPAIAKAVPLLGEQRRRCHLHPPLPGVHYLCS